MVNNIFREKIGHTVEVYVDDMLLRSSNLREHIEDLSNTFAVLSVHNMKLNIEKCAFGVRIGKFSGFMVLKIGIGANLEKIWVILVMPSPNTTKDIHRLTGRVVTLNKFVSKMVGKCLPFCKA